MFNLPVCRPCPPNTICYGGQIKECISSFVLEPHPLTAIGLPFHPICVPDTVNLKHADKLRHDIVERIEFRTGQNICRLAGTDWQPQDIEIDEAELKQYASTKLVHLLLLCNVMDTRLRWRMIEPIDGRTLRDGVGDRLDCVA